MFYTCVLLEEQAPTALLRRCSICGIEKPLSEFHRYRDGHMWWCRSCRREWDARYYAAHAEIRRAQTRANRKRLTDRMRELKAAPCMDCGGTFHPAAMQFDHRPGTTKVADLASLARDGSSRLFELELAKCDLVCANCHAIRTFRRREEQRAVARASAASISEAAAIYRIAA
jgi:hypothetical protein